MAVKVVNTPQVDDIVERLEGLLVRARQGEFSSLFVVAHLAGNTSFVSNEYGVRLDRLRMIGILECMKMDMMRAMDVDE